MFTLKLKGNPKTEKTNELKLKINGNVKTITNEKYLSQVLTKFEIDDIMIYIEDTWRRTWNLYFKDFTQSWLCEGVVDD